MVVVVAGDVRVECRSSVMVGDVYEERTMFFPSLTMEPFYTNLPRIPQFFLESRRSMTPTICGESTSNLQTRRIFA